VKTAVENNNQTKETFFSPQRVVYKLFQFTELPDFMESELYKQAIHKKKLNLQRTNRNLERGNTLYFYNELMKMRCQSQSELSVS